MVITVAQQCSIFERSNILALLLVCLKHEKQAGVVAKIRVLFFLVFFFCFFA